MRRLADLSLEQFSSQLAARTPAPGGGCASALTAALGVSLANMVIVFTLGKPAFVRQETMLKRVAAKNEQRRRRSLELVDADAVAYASKDRAKAMAVPLELCRLCLLASADCLRLVGRTNPYLASDLAAAALLLEAGFTSACYSVEANLAGCCQEARARSLRRKLDAGRRKIARIRKQVEAGVGRTLRR